MPKIRVVCPECPKTFDAGDKGREKFIEHVNVKHPGYFEEQRRRQEEEFSA